MFANIITLSWVVFIAYWIARALGNKRTQSHHKAWSGGMVARIVLILLLIFLWIVPLFSLLVFLPNTALKITGLILCIAGLIFAIQARRVLGKNWSAHPLEINPVRNSR